MLTNTVDDTGADGSTIVVNCDVLVLPNCFSVPALTNNNNNI